MVRLGLEPTRQIAMGVLLSDGFGELDDSLYDLDELWRHLLIVAMLADALAWLETPPGAPRPPAFTAGLLHDVGRLAMLALEPRACAAVFELVANGIEPLEAERELVGDDHAAWGGRVAREWGLPEPIPQAIAGHHGDASEEPLADVLQQARGIAFDIGVGDGVLPAGPPAEQLDALARGAVAHLGGVAQIFARVQWFRGTIGA